MGTQEISNIPPPESGSSSEFQVQTGNGNQSREVESTMRSEAQRLSTFTSWPHNDKVEARKIAKAGFFHTGIDSEVKCLWCGTVLNEWEYGDQVMARHKAANPGCPFIKNESDNVPLLATNNEQTQQLNSSSQPSQQQGIIQDREESQDESDNTPMEAQNNDSGEDETIADTANSSRPIRQVPMVAPSPDLQNFRSESARLQTFRTWTHRTPRPADLASAGFIYMGNGDMVRCVFCGQYVGNWEEEDFPITEHRALFPECPFIQGHDVGNIPLSQFYASNPPFLNVPEVAPPPSYDETGIRPRESDSYDVTGTSRGGRGRDAHSGPEKGPNVQLINGVADEKSMKIIPHTGPASTKYSTLEARLRTFKDWPPALKQEPRQLADAGFYYIGLSDQTKCFYCEGGLRNWQPDDDPWTEHARWFTKCGYVRLIKGDEFIAKCVEEIPTQELPKDKDTNIRKVLTEEDLKSMMTMPMVQEVLAMGINESRVRIALEKNGKMYQTANELASAALSVQLEQARIPATPMPPSESQPSTSTGCGGTNSSEQIPEQPPTPCNSLGEPGPPSSSDLEQENQRLKEARTCKICMDNEIGVVFLPCGHFICCVKCAPSLRDCPYCRQSIHGTVKTYMS